MADSEWVLELVVRLPISSQPGVEAFRAEKDRANDMSVEIVGAVEQHMIDRFPNAVPEVASVADHNAYKRAADCPTPGYSHVFTDGEEVVCVRRDRPQGIVPGDFGTVYIDGPTVQVETMGDAGFDTDVLRYSTHAEACRFWEVSD